MYIPTVGDTCCLRTKHEACPFSMGRYECWAECGCTKAVEITVNGDPVRVGIKQMGYSHAVELAYQLGYKRSKELAHSVIFSYRNEDGFKVSGILTPTGPGVQIVSGMHITALVTDNA